MVIIILIVSILVVEFYNRINDFMQGSKCISMSMFKTNNYLPKFEEIYNTVWIANGQQITILQEKTRAIILLKYVLQVLSIFFILLGIYMFFLKQFITTLLLLIISIVFIHFTKYTKNFEKEYLHEYLEKYKELIINNYIRHINKGFGYSLRTCIDKEIFAKSYDNEIIIDHYYGTDYVTGVVEGTRTMNMCELYTKYKECIKKDKYRNDVFCGLFAFFKTDYDNNMQLECENKRIKYKNIPLNMQVKIEKYIKEFELKQTVDFKLMVKEGKIYIKLYTGDILRPSAFSKEENKKRLWAYYTIIKFVVDLTDLMNNVRIKNK